MEASALAAPPPPTRMSNPRPASAWGSATRQSCDDLIDRLERNDPLLRDVVILPAKRFGAAEVERLASILEGQRDTGDDDRKDDDVLERSENSTSTGSDSYHWQSLSASSHALPPESLARLGRAVATSSALNVASNKGSTQLHRPRGPVLVDLAIGDDSTGDEGIRALCRDGFLTMPNGSASSSLSLERLDLSHKGMTGLGLADVVLSLRGSRNLRELNLSRNDYSDAFQDFEQLWKPQEGGGDCQWFPALEDIDLSHCNLEPVFVNEFFQRLGSKSSTPATSMTTATTTKAAPLLRLHLAGNSSLMDSGFKALWSWQWDRLRELDVSNCGLDDSAVMALCHHVQNCPETGFGGRTCPLEILNLSGNSIGSAGASVLGPWLGSSSMTSSTFLPHLTELHISRNPLGGDGVQALVNGLKDRHHFEAPASNSDAVPPPRIQVLDVSSTDCDAPAAFRAIRDSGVETLLLHGNRLGKRTTEQGEPSAGGFELLAHALRGGHPTIRYLDLSLNGADQKSVVILLESLLVVNAADDAESVSPDPSLRERNWSSVLVTLVLGGNDCGPEVDAAVARAQERHPGLVVPRR